MQKKNRIFIILSTLTLVLLGIGVNYIGRMFALWAKLPLWLDSVGTGIVAGVLGPFYGAGCGVISNVLYGLTDAKEFAYIITSIVIGLIIGICTRKGMFQKFFNMLTVGVLVAFSVVLVSTPFNFILTKGLPGNLWGDALFDMLRGKGIIPFAAGVISELFVEFPDKVVTVLITYLLLQLPFLRREMQKQIEIHNKKTEQKRSGKTKKKSGILPIVLILVMLSTEMTFPFEQNVPSFAEEKGSELLLLSDSEGTSFSNRYAQMIYNNENGLLAGEANAIVTTKDGYLWIGTYAGLYRYDGKNFTSMKFDSVKNVNCLYVDDENRLYIGTNDMGISVYENGNMRHILTRSLGLPSNSVRCIEKGKNGDLYIGTSGAFCIARQEAEDIIKVQKVFPEIGYASEISVAEDGMVAMVTNSGSLFLMQDQTIIGSYTLDVEKNHFTSCVFRKNGTLYLGSSSNQVYEWDFTKQAPNLRRTIETGVLANIHYLYEDEENAVVWLCADNGIGYFNESRNFSTLKSGAFSSSIDSVTKDYQGNIWFASSRLGLLKLTRTILTNVYYQYGLDEKVVNSVSVWEGMLYVGTDMGLDIIDMISEQPVDNILTDYFSNHRIRCLMVDSKNQLWAATSDGTGLIRISTDGEIVSYGKKDGTVGDRFRSVIELSDGTIAAAENTGIDFIKNGKVTGTLGEEDGLESPQILCLYETEDHDLIAGSDGAGLFIIQNKKVVKQITETKGLTSGVILRIVPIEEGYLIVTSNSICFMNRDYKVWELKNFPYSNNFDIIPAEDGTLWVLSSAGIYIVNKDDLISAKDLTYELLDSKKGLKTSLTANSWNHQEGSLLFLSCSTGVFSIDMNNYNNYKGYYQIMVDVFDEENNRYQADSVNSTLIPKESTRFKIRPELLNFTMNDPYVSYYLEGYDTSETIVSQSSLTDLVYTNLPSGTYIFHLAVLDSTGSHVIQKTAYTIRKLPQFFEHAWFTAYLIFVCVLAVVYLTWLVAVLRSNKVIEKQKQEIELARKQAEMGNETILAIAKTVDARDVNTSEHSERVSEYSVMLAEQLGWSREECENLRKIALLHDIGKVGIPDSILNKPSRLTEEEYATMKSHVAIGAKILKGFTIVDHVQDGVLYHHERYDGKGYVNGLKGEEIPLDARIIGLADAFDAMTSNRVYRKKMDKEYVIGELKKGRGTQFDPQLVDLMLTLIQEGRIQAFHE